MYCTVPTMPSAADVVDPATVLASVGVPVGTIVAAVSASRCAGRTLVTAAGSVCATLDVGARGRIGHDLGADDFDRDRDAKLRVPRVIDSAHAADAEEPDDVIARAERLTGRERTGIGARTWRGRDEIVQARVNRAGRRG